MRFLFLLFFLASSFAAKAQMDIYYGADLSRIGFRSNTVYSNVKITDERFGRYQAVGDTVSAVNSNLVFETMSKHVYFSTDLSILLDATLGLIGAYGGLEEKYPGMENVEAFNTALAFGFPFAKYFNFYAGGQYQFSEFSYNGLTVGGNQRGLGTHLVFGSPYLFARYTYQYDWLRRENKQFKGMSNTNELAIGIFPSKDIRIGFMFKARARQREMDPVLDGAALFPAMKTRDYVFSFSIVIPGVVSGTSRTISKGVYETNKEFNGTRKGYEYNSLENQQLKKNGN